MPRFVKRTGEGLAKQSILPFFRGDVGSPLQVQRPLAGGLSLHHLIVHWKGDSQRRIGSEDVEGGQLQAGRHQEQKGAFVHFVLRLGWDALSSMSATTTVWFMAGAVAGQTSLSPRFVRAVI